MSATEGRARTLVSFRIDADVCVCVCVHLCVCASLCLYASATQCASQNPEDMSNALGVFCHNLRRTNVPCAIFVGFPTKKKMRRTEISSKLVVYLVISPSSPDKPTSDASSLVPLLGRAQKAQRSIRSSDQQTRKWLVMFGLTCVYIRVCVHLKKWQYMYAYVHVCTYARMHICMYARVPVESV